ncbi:hypothetical protein VIGAN_09041100 [Vigna angularis var. angularis]|uniref:Secreted protein n=1 Tax=Vigna angularis var. angularis TaxID=157739 RepID=A0A0S3SVY0_PHAAN|nr:hypothetical protein VIGAN_09041100 [Vigna angularis var. angularis]
MFFPSCWPFLDVEGLLALLVGPGLCLELDVGSCFPSNTTVCTSERCFQPWYFLHALPGRVLSYWSWTVKLLPLQSPHLCLASSFPKPRP